MVRFSTATTVQTCISNVVIIEAVCGSIRSIISQQEILSKETLSD